MSNSQKSEANQYQKALTDGINQMSILCHELRNPLNGVLGYTSLLNETILNSEQRELLSGIKSSSEQLMQVLENVLDLSNPNQLNESLINPVFSLNQVIYKSLNAVYPDCIKKNITLFFSSEITDELYCKGNEVSLYQIILNLLSNAVKFTGSGFVEIIVSKDFENHGQIGLRINVNDSGIGIDDKALTDIFLPYYKEIASADLNTRGAGIGLSVVKKLVEAMDGKIEVKSRTGIGSVFTLQLTFDKCKTADFIGLNNVLFKHNFIEHKKKKPKILLVEDSELNRLLVKKVLETNGFCVIDVAGGNTAAQYLELFYFDMVIADFNLPDINGLELLKMNKSKCKLNTPCILLTASDSIDEASNLYADVILHKPVLPDQLIFAIQKLFN